MLLSCTLFATWLNVDVGLLLLLSLPMPPGRDTSGILSGDAVVVICDFNQKRIIKNFSRNWRSKTYLPRCLIKRTLSQLDQDYYPRKSLPRVFVGPVPLPLSADRSYLPPRGSRSVSLIHRYLQVKKYEISVTSAICLRSCEKHVVSNRTYSAWSNRSCPARSNPRIRYVHSGAGRNWKQ